MVRFLFGHILFLFLFSQFKCLLNFWRSCSLVKIKKYIQRMRMEEFMAS